jgi:hypothetical protein
LTTGKPARGAGYNKDERSRRSEENPASSRLRLSKIEMSLKTWIKRLGFWGIVFFLLKGLLWLTIPALIAIFAN